uniref:Transposase domain-containing protein n=1 Tax=Cryptococcus neoformans TaxID=5207 RepID=A0JPR7_CRYNE|nr:TPA: transposase domain-containing protein [Cryptococcus neoformans]
MSEEDIDKIGLYSWKVDHNISRAAYNSLPDHANNIPFISLKEAQSLIDNYSDTLCDYYDMCKHSCLCFAGPYAKDQKCSKCGADRFDRNGKPFQRFLYIKIIPRLQKMYNHPSTKERLMYRDKSTREYDNSNIQDIFDGSMYRILLEKEIEVDGRKLGTKYFADDRDIALSFSSDGFCPFDNGSGTCWPLVLFNLNLPPEERVHTREILSVGLIPGPKKPEDFDSFIYPLVEELLQLTVGVHTWDADLGSFFTLRAHLLYVSGDTPAVSMIMHMKGTGSFHPCRMCNATSV